MFKLIFFFNNNKNISFLFIFIFNEKYGIFYIHDLNCKKIKNDKNSIKYKNKLSKSRTIIL